MVDCMAALPADVGHEQEAVQHKPRHRLDARVAMEGMMAAFIGDHPAELAWLQEELASLAAQRVLADRQHFLLDANAQQEWERINSRPAPAACLG